MEQTQQVGSPLRIICNPSEEEVSVKAGKSDQPFELSVTVINLGLNKSLVDIFIDDRFGPVREWCSDPDRQCDLESKDSCEVVFKFDNIPPETIPDAYEYLLTIDARQDYPEYTPIINKGILEVQPPVKDTRQQEAHTFTLEPVTTSETPIPLQPGEQLEFLVTVHNHTPKVDRFYLTCPELTREWFNVIYSEDLASDNDALKLNPSESGHIKLQFQPPPNSRAQIYAPTIRLYSANLPELALLDIVYFQVVPLYELELEFLSLVPQVKDRPGKYELRSHNRGNTVRELNLRFIGNDEDRLYTYTLTPDQVKVLPESTQTVSLRVQPKPRWRRPFFSKLFNFALAVEDRQQLPLQTDRFEGSLIWEPRPWWQFWLFLLLMFGLGGAIILGIWWLLFNPPQPKIIAFDSTGSSYQEGNPIALNWRITHPKRLETLKLQGLSPEGIVISDPIDYDLSQGIPKPLQKSCFLDQRLGLICKNVPTDAFQTGNYTFELSLIPKNSDGIVATTSSTKTIPIQASPQPKIIKFAANQLFYQEGEGGKIQLNWQITHPEQIKQLKLISRAPDGTVISPDKNLSLVRDGQNKLSKICEVDDKQQNTKCKPAADFDCQITKETLSCTDMKINAKRPGDYSYELRVIPQVESVPTAAVKTDLIKLEAIPKIADLTWKVLEEYQKNKKVNVVLLDWKITNASRLKTLVLNKIRPNCQNAICIESTETIAKDLEQCQINSEDELICQNVPRTISLPGNYIYKLIAIPDQSPKDKIPDTQQTGIISIIKIVELSINNIPALIKPKQTFIVDPLKAKTVKIKWKVEGGKKIKVELLPSPGNVAPEGEIIYPLSPKEQTEKIILQVTNEAGEQISRSALIETAIRPLPPLPLPLPPLPPLPESESSEPAEVTPKTKVN